MTTIAEVKMWGTTIGAVMMEDGEQTARFQYDGAFAKSGITLSPLMMPTGNAVYEFPALSRHTFHGLPGMLADSLPDKFGNALIDAWLARQGRSASSFNAVERLCYTGARGMGALEYVPATGPESDGETGLSVAHLVELANAILSHRDGLDTSFAADTSLAIGDILKVGTSAGGARAKAVIAWNPTSGQVRSGQTTLAPGFEHWLLKFDGISNNRDKELADPQGFGAIEYAYYRMACDSGIQMSECRLLEEGGRRHFMTRRFDRMDNDKRHMQTLGALAHMDYNLAGAYGYEQAMDVARRLGLSASATSQLFRRMVFNVVARNQNDHVKNIAFLMDREGRWSLAPAYDMTYSYYPGGRWTSQHQMTVNGKRDHFTRDDFDNCGSVARLKRGEAGRVLGDVLRVVTKWRDYADNAAVNPQQRDAIWKTLRLDI
jgi:serine/threonine-protein kinase HipA